MKAIIVPKTAIPPKEYTLVLQITKNEAEAMLDVYEFANTMRGYKPASYLKIVESLKQFINYEKEE